MIFALRSKRRRQNKPAAVSRRRFTIILPALVYGLAEAEGAALGEAAGEAKGGDDQGPMGGELFLAAVGGCFMSNLLAAIKGREAEVSGAHTEVIGVLDGSPARFTSVELNVTANYSDREQFEKLVEIADRGCIMMNTLRGKLDIKLRIAAMV